MNGPLISRQCPIALRRASIMWRRRNYLRIDSRTVEWAGLWRTSGATLQHGEARGQGIERVNEAREY